MLARSALSAFCLAGVGTAQQAGTLVVEAGPSLHVERCTKAAGCTREPSTATMDSNWRWTHDAAGWHNCFTDSSWSTEYCTDPSTCASKCAVEGIDAQGYANTYGVRPTPGGVELQFVADGGNVGSRIYLLDDEESYKVFKLKNREFTFTVDASTIACGMNGAVYFVEMDAKGGKGTRNNAAGAKYGTGYCDAQCPHDIKWTGGEANLQGQYGMCCVELDIFEANGRASAYTTHPCEVEGSFRCEGSSCGDGDRGERYKGVCDKDGCDLNPYRMGVHDFYGMGEQFAVNTQRPVTVVTQFLTTNGTDEGELSEIRRIYVQDGRVIASADSAVPGVAGSSITDSYCGAQKAAFADPDDHTAKGGLKRMGEAMDRGMVLVLSLWDDAATEMRWLDSTFPAAAAASVPGVLRGPCDGTTSSPAYVRQAHAQATIKYTNIKHGEIGSTFESGRRLGSVFL